jgi:hypothetical protein
MRTCLSETPRKMIIPVTLKTVQ